MANKIQFKRGLKANLPVLSMGEPAFCTDTEEAFIGNGTSNIGIAKASDLAKKELQAQLQLTELQSLDLPDTNLATIGNPQGVTYDGTSLYVSFRQHLYKINPPTNAIVVDIDTTSAGSFGDDNGDLQYYNGFLYVCNSNYRHSGIDGKISKYDCNSLAFIQEYSLPTLNGPSTIAFKDGYFWIIRYTSPATLQKWTLDFSQMVSQYTLPIANADGITWHGDHLIVNPHEDASGNVKWGNMFVYYFRNETFTLVNTILKRDLWGQGIHFDISSNILFITKRGYDKSKNKIIFSSFTTKAKPMSICRAYLSWYQSNIPTSTWTKVNIDTVSIDVLDDFDLVNKKFVAPFTGYYEISIGVVWRGTKVVPSKRYSATIAINSAFGVQHYCTDNKHSTIADYLTNMVTDIIALKAGDSVEVYAKHESGVDTAEIFNNQANTFMSIKSL